MSKVNIIAAIDEKNGLGKNGIMPWHIPEDLRRFKEITQNHTIIMGRKTFESIGKALPDRTNIVITSNSQFQAQDVEVVHSLEQALEEAKGDIFVIGGGEIFKQAIEITDKLYLTQIEGDFNCDTFFPDYSKFANETFIGAGEINGIRYKFLELEK